MPTLVVAVLGLFLDLETNGLDPWRHVPIDLAIRFVDLRSGRQMGLYETKIACSREEWDRADPESTKVNGLRWEDVEHAPPRERVGQELLQLFKQLDVRRGSAVFVGQNPSFDRAFFSQLVPVEQQEALQLPYHWLDLASMYWAYVVLDWRRGGEQSFLGFSKDQIAQTMGLPPEKKPHGALQGVDHLLACYTSIIGWPDQQLQLK